MLTRRAFLPAHTSPTPPPLPLAATAVAATRPTVAPLVPTIEPPDQLARLAAHYVAIHDRCLAMEDDNDTSASEYEANLDASEPAENAVREAMEERGMQALVSGGRLFVNTRTYFPTRVLDVIVIGPEDLAPQPPPLAEWTTERAQTGGGVAGDPRQDCPHLRAPGSRAQGAGRCESLPRRKVRP